MFLTDIEAAASRLAPHIRFTPVLDPVFLREPVTDARLRLKLENLQVTGSFKVRGALNFALTQPPDKIRSGLVTSSGGNHGLAVAYAARVLGVSADVFVPFAVPADRVRKLKEWGARVRIAGQSMEEVREIARAFAADEHKTYIHQFAEPAVVAGQGTLGLEILRQIPDVDTVLVAIGGGGLIGGVAAAIKAERPQCRVIGIEAEGAAKIVASRKTGKLLSVTSTTKAISIGVGATTIYNYDLIQRYADDVVAVSDDAMTRAALWLWRECSVAAELAGAAGIAALMTGVFKPRAGETVCALVCGGGRDGLK